MCLTATVSGGEVEAFDLGVEVNVKGSGLDRYIVLAEVSMLPCVARLKPGFGEVVGIRRLSVVA